MTAPLLATVGGKGRSPENLNTMAHRHHSSTMLANGLTREFPLPVTVLRLEDVAVSVGGVLVLVANRNAPNDYAVRGLTAGYSGDSNRVRFTVIPPNGARVTFSAVGG